MKSNHWWNDLENMFSRISKKSQRPKVLKEPILFFFYLEDRSSYEIEKYEKRISKSRIKNCLKIGSLIT